MSRLLKKVSKSPKKSWQYGFAKLLDQLYSDENDKKDYRTAYAWLSDFSHGKHIGSIHNLKIDPSELDGVLSQIYDNLVWILIIFLKEFEEFFPIAETIQVKIYNEINAELSMISKLMPNKPSIGNTDTTEQLIDVLVKGLQVELVNNWKT